jgi:hypothetical protein
MAHGPRCGNSTLVREVLRADLKDGAEYEVQFDSVTHQVEVEILEDTAAYVHVSIAVDDGSLPASIFPASDSFIQRVG